MRTPQTVGFGIALMCIFGIMTAYIGGSELIIDEVFGREDQFALIFGALALFMAAGSFFNARFVMRIGLQRVLRYGALYLVGAAALLTIIAVVSGGTPPLLLFALAVAVLLPSVAVIMPNANTAAMQPLPHVAGTAAAILGTVSTAGGALLGSVIDSRFDGTIRPFAQGVLVYGARRRGRHPAARPARASRRANGRSRSRCGRSPPRTEVRARRSPDEDSVGPGVNRPACCGV